MLLPVVPKIYHIVHWNRLESIISDGFLWCDAIIQRRTFPGTTIGMPEIKRKRLIKKLTSRPGLRVGDCVPFYFCPRSVMLFVIYKMNHRQLTYRDGQGLVVHLEADLHEAVAWADQCGRRWAFTLSNASSQYFEDHCDLAHLSEVNWQAVQARDWRNHMDAKQAEFLVEESFPWTLVRRIGVQSWTVHEQVCLAVRKAAHQPDVEVVPDWYY